MARTRMIKPEFFKNKFLSDVDPYARLLFIGLWGLADREGKLKDDPEQIGGELFFREMLRGAVAVNDVDGWLDELATDNDDESVILRYEVNGKRYIKIKNFVEHQHVHHREAESEIPNPAPTQPRANKGQEGGKNEKSSKLNDNNDSSEQPQPSPNPAPTQPQTNPPASTSTSTSTKEEEGALPDMDHKPRGNLFKRASPASSSTSKNNGREDPEDIEFIKKQFDELGIEYFQRDNLVMRYGTRYLYECLDVYYTRLDQGNVKEDHLKYLMTIIRTHGKDRETYIPGPYYWGPKEREDVGEN